MHYFYVILLNFIPYLPIYTCLYIPQPQQMESTAYQVRNYHSLMKQEAHLERALPFKKIVNLEWQWHILTSNSAFKYYVVDG